MLIRSSAAARESVEEVEHAAAPASGTATASARGSMPGIGTNDSSRNRISAPSVNEQALLELGGLGEAGPRQMLAASCSAADAMRDDSLKRKRPKAATRHASTPLIRGSEAIHSPLAEASCARKDESGLRLRLGRRDLVGLVVDAGEARLALLGGGLLGADTVSMTSTLPPAFSTASIAPFDAPATVKLSLAVSSPLPSRRTPSWPPRARPAAFSAAWSSAPLASSFRRRSASGSRRGSPRHSPWRRCC